MKDDSLNFFFSIPRVLSPRCGPERRGRTMIGMYDSRNSIIERSRRVGAEVAQFEARDKTIKNITYQMEGEI